MASFRARTIKNVLYGLAYPQHPSYLILYVNNICQLRCNMCFYWDAMQIKTDQLDLEEIDKIASHFHHLLQLTLTGGEPSLRKDLPKIPGIFSKRSQLAKCTVITNGMLPERVRDSVDEMTTQNPEVDFRIVISLDGTEAIHDQIRGVKGSFANAIKTLEFLYSIRDRTQNLWLDVSTVISKYNYHMIEEIYEYVKNNLKVDNFSFSFVRGKTKEREAKDLPAEAYRKLRSVIAKEPIQSKHFFQVPTSMIREIVKDMVEHEILANTFHHYCKAGKKFIEIYQDGRVAPCEILETRMSNAILGNIKDYDYNINKLLSSPYAQRLLQWIADTKCHCSFECPKHMDAMYSKQFYPRIFKGLVKELL